MKEAKLTIGIISIVLSLIIFLQSGISFIYYSGGLFGYIISFCFLIAGIIGIVTHKSNEKNGSYIAAVIFAIGTFVGFFYAGDFFIFKLWALVSSVFGIVFYMTSSTRQQFNIKDIISISGFAIVIFMFYIFTNY
ncbi:hypothetical protein FXB42_06700 [Acetobacterium wieringae]|uniref:Uncharacterized protein n=1 Tax=Acetobacterium wieringae TaxID=52694 RepID=A0A5D0WRJ9_9FIRM|nr:hypothetical protein [Acetobacterium wieringae]TYC86371.1 hypothetical protein FXB42_06700 [Acetobacterium wieringae]